MRHKELLETGKKQVAIIGLGYLGYSNLIQYLKQGIRCVVTDFKKTRLKEFVDGDYPPKNRFLYWSAVEELKEGFNMACSCVDPGDIVSDDIAVYVMCVPYYHRASEPFGELKKAIGLFKKAKEVYKDFRPLIIFESMLRPSTMEKQVIPEFARAGLEPGKDIIVAYAPRRDWFLGELESGATARILSAVGKDADEISKDVLGITGQQVMIGNDMTSVEIAACLGSSLSHIESALIDQLMFAYPENNIREVIRLLDTRPRKVSLGVSNLGENIPLSSQFLIDAASRSQYLNMLHDTLSTGFSVQQGIVELLKRKGSKHVAILGLLPHENIAEYRLTQAMMLPKLLKNEQISVVVNDPFISGKDIKEITGCDACDFPEGLRDADTVIVLTSHAGYITIPKIDLMGYLKNCRYVFDATGSWKRYGFNGAEGFEYKVLGEPFSLIG